MVRDDRVESNVSVNGDVIRDGGDVVFRRECIKDTRLSCYVSANKINVARSYVSPMCARQGKCTVWAFEVVSMKCIGFEMMKGARRL